MISDFCCRKDVYKGVDNRRLWTVLNEGVDKREVINRDMYRLNRLDLGVSIAFLSTFPHTLKKKRKSLLPFSSSKIVENLPHLKGCVMEAAWLEKLKEELVKPYFVELMERIEEEAEKGATIYPPKKEIFNAFLHTPYNAVKVVIVGQDPYHGPNQAQGLCFSVKEGIKPPPSLVNIFKEINADIGPYAPKNGSLVSWADQGVLLLNAILTVQEKKPASHQGIGWERFTDKVLETVALREDPVVFILWGKYAQNKGEKIREIAEKQGHAILTSAHPSPFSAHSGFFGCRHFSKTNQLLEKWAKVPINWRSNE